MNPDQPNIPDLDPRTDAHIIGHLNLTGFLVLLGGLFIIATVVLSLGTAIWGEIVSIVLTVVLGGFWSIWIVADGPRIWVHRRQWKRRQRIRPQMAGLPLAFGADQASDPFWTADGTTWAAARLNLPPVMLLDDGDIASWHHRLAQGLRMAVMHGVTVDIRAAQLPGSLIVPRGDLNTVTSARWQWWMQSMGPRSVNDVVTVRLGWPRADRNMASLHFLSVEQAWRSIPGPGEWQWLSATSARQMVEAAANPAQAYALWSHQVRQATVPQSSPPQLRRLRHEARS